MIDVPERSSRPPPDPDKIRKVDGTVDHDRLARENASHTRKESDRIWAAIRELRRGIPGDSGDIVRVESAGHGELIEVPHNLPEVPNCYDVASQSGPGSLGLARANLADEDRAYFRAYAQAGVVFRVRLYRAEARGSGFEEVRQSDETEGTEDEE